MKKILNVIHEIYRTILNPLCLLCGFKITDSKSAHLCNDCKQKLPPLPPHCQQCGQPFVENNNSPYMNFDLICKICSQKIRPCDRILSIFPYEPPLIKAIFKLKFSHQLHFANFFSELLLEKIKNDWYRRADLPQLIIPIPLHPQRLRERGFNQSLEIVKPIAKALKIKLEPLAVQRKRATPTQRRLKAQARLQNMENVFISHRNFEGLRVVIVDDVITTGATINACASLLKQNGAKEIEVWSCIRQFKYCS